MSKSYEIKPLAILLTIFNSFMFLGSLVLISLINKEQSLALIGGAVNGFILYLIGMLGSAVGATLLYIYYFKKEKVLSVLVLAIANTCCALFGVMTLTSESSLLSGSTGMFYFTTFICFITLAVTIALMLRIEEILMITNFDVYLPTGKAGYNTLSEKGNQASTLEIKEFDNDTQNTDTNTTIKPAIDVEKVKMFFKSKNGKITICIVALIVTLFSGYKVWDSFFNKTEIDAFANLSVNFEGYNGSGKVEIGKGDIDYDINNPKIANFINTINFECEKENIKNGDKVIVKATYSTLTAKELKLVLKEETKEYKASGLIVKYQKADEINKALYQKAYSDFSNYVKKEIVNSDTVASIVKGYYVSEPEERIDSQENKLVFVVKSEETSRAFLSETVEKTIYYRIYPISFDSSYTSENAYYRGRILDKAGDYKAVEQDSEVFDAIKKEYDDYKIEEMIL